MKELPRLALDAVYKLSVLTLLGTSKCKISERPKGSPPSLMILINITPLTKSLGPFSTQTFQYPSNKEDTLSHIRDPTIA